MALNPEEQRQLSADMNARLTATPAVAEVAAAEHADANQKLDVLIEDLQMLRGEIPDADPLIPLALLHTEVIAHATPRTLAAVLLAAVDRLASPAMPAVPDGQ